jgi:cobyrinic acid a,c-diamide synthase
MKIVIGGVHSGVGKTTITAGLISALRGRGLTVQPFKVGPDYIDPGYHTLAAGCPCRNIDTWMVSPEQLGMLFYHHARSADISVLEGVMGVFDGQGYLEETGSTAEVAKLTGSPVVLVIDAGKMARSAAAIALGFQRFDPGLPIAGFIVNHVAGQAHGEGVAAAIEQATGLPVLGCVPRNLALEIPERHLGLIPTSEPGRWQEFIQAAAEHVSRHIDIDQLLEIAAQAPPGPGTDLLAELQAIWQPDVTRQPVIAVARDQAFNFIYEENLDLLRAAGARIVFFSPLSDNELPADTCGVILSGGFPEHYAQKLSANAGMRQALQAAHSQGLPIYAECGGLMALTQSITDLNGREHPMFGLLPGRSVMTHRLNMGYRLACAASNSWLMEPGEEIRGHEFHYSTWEDRPANLPPAYSLLPSSGQGRPVPDGASLGSLWASYLHLPFWGKPELALRFASRCREMML